MGSVFGWMARQGCRVSFDDGENGSGDCFFFMLCSDRGFRVRFPMLYECLILKDAVPSASISLHHASIFPLTQKRSIRLCLMWHVPHSAVWRHSRRYLCDGISSFRLRWIDVVPLTASHPDVGFSCDRSRNRVGAGDLLYSGECFDLIVLIWIVCWYRRRLSHVKNESTICENR